MRMGTGSRSSDCRARFDAIWSKELAEAEVPIRVEAEVAAMEVNRDPVVDRVGVAAPEPDVSQAQPTQVSRERGTTGGAKRAAETHLTPNSVEGYIGGLRNFDGHQDEQTNVMSAIETMNETLAAETIDEDSRRYDYYTGEFA